jgi:hypothetical protein
MLQFGAIANPLKKFNSYGDLTDTGTNGGLIVFVSNFIKFAVVVAGLFAFFNLIGAGYMYISAGSDSKKTAEAWAKIYMSLIGLVVIIASFAIAGILGYLLFGNADAILNPKIYGPGAP